ncbi:unnamed protein product [Eretmochelys imbricata]
MGSVPSSDAIGLYRLRQCHCVGHSGISPRSWGHWSRLSADSGRVAVLVAPGPVPLSQGYWCRLSADKNSIAMSVTMGSAPRTWGISARALRTQAASLYRSLWPKAPLLRLSVKARCRRRQRGSVGHCGLRPCRCSSRSRVSLPGAMGQGSLQAQAGSLHRVLRGQYSTGAPGAGSGSGAPLWGQPLWVQALCGPHSGPRGYGSRAGALRPSGSHLPPHGNPAYAASPHAPGNARNGQSGATRPDPTGPASTPAPLGATCRGHVRSPTDSWDM